MRHEKLDSQAAILAWRLVTDVEVFQGLIREERYRLTLHAETEREADHITARDIREALLSDQAEIIESYPDDPRGPSFLFLGFTQEGQPIHFVCAVADAAIVITLYRPDPEHWINWRVRREGA